MLIIAVIKQKNLELKRRCITLGDKNKTLEQDVNER